MLRKLRYPEFLFLAAIVIAVFAGLALQLSGLHAYRHCSNLYSSIFLAEGNKPCSNPQENLSLVKETHHQKAHAHHDRRYQQFSVIT